MASVVVAGSFNVDHVWTCVALPRPGETLAGEYRTGPGGKGFNQAMAAARAGARTAFVCALGDDAGAQLARALAAGDDIDLREARSVAPTGTAGIYVDREGRNSIVIGPGANATLSASFIDTQAALLAQARVVLAQLESPTGAVLRALDLARAAGATTLLNPAPANAPCGAELLAAADVLTPNETEFAALLDAHAGVQVDPAAVARADDATLHAWCRRLHAHGTVVVTLGAEGCFVSHGSDLRGDAQPCQRAAAEHVDVVDTTGAGDAFNGALAASLALAPALRFAAHVRFANRYAALSTEQAGAASTMPRRADVERRFPA